MNVTDADREAALTLVQGLGANISEVPVVAKWVARRRIQATKQSKAIGRREALEEAAKVAREHNLDDEDCCSIYALTIAAAIRALIGETK